MNLRVVAGVADYENVLRRDHPHQAVQKTRGAYPACQRHDHKPVIRMPACFTLLRRLIAISNETRFSIRRPFRNGPASTARAPGSIVTSSAATSLAWGSSAQISTSLSIP